MRTLLLDNHDSFTANLHHQLARVNGREPVVVRNDDPAWRPADLDAFDNVVISPGPGTPHRLADVGICRDVVDRAEIPLLGVCLGHQALCLAHGATVGPAPEPRHGLLSPVRHTGTGLFAGLPSPFDVVRYHSLAVTDLPPELEPLAVAEDGVLMAVRHRGRPAWGVQFHPESISTAHGDDLLANFHRLTPRRTTREEIPRSAPARPAPAHRVVVRTLDVHPSPEVVFDALHGAAEHAFWLDSSGGGGRFSFLGDASGPLARVATHDVARRLLTVSGEQQHVESFFDWLDADTARNAVLPPDLPFDFALGWVGYLGYELKAETGGNPAHRSAHPDAAMIFADRAVAFDHDLRRVHLLALEGAATGWLDETERVLRVLADTEPPPPAAPVRVPGDVRPRHSRSQYLKLVAACQEAVAAGETYEVCLTNTVSWDGVLDPREAYRVLRRQSPAPFAALLRFADLWVLSASPERFLRVTADGQAESRPIKGTRPRGDNPERDAALRADLASSVKDRAENLMIVDLVRNDLGTCAEIGSVEVPDMFRVESYATVHQLVSTVRARLRPNASAVRCVRAAFPGGSMTGAPKIRTMQILDDLEAGPRGVYSGALGYFSLSGSADFSIVIRTLVVDDGEVTFGVGGAVIALSDPGQEFEETVVKATAALRLLGATFPGR